MGPILHPNDQSRVLWLDPPDDFWQDGAAARRSERVPDTTHPGRGERNIMSMQFARVAARSVRPSAALVALAMAGQAASAQFLPLGVLSDRTPDPGSFGVGLTPDGNTAVGHSNVDFDDGVGGVLSYANAFRWTRSGGTLFNLGVPEGGLGGSSAARVSGDGSVVVGTTGFSLSGQYEARNGTIWTDAASNAPVAQLVAEAYTVQDVSRDGRFVAGTTRVPGDPFPTPNLAYIWEHGAGPLRELGTLPGGSYSVGHAISGAGDVVVGTGDAGVGFVNAWRWTEPAGMQMLAGLPADRASEAFDISADGRTIVGQSGGELYRWSETGGAEILGKLPGAAFLTSSIDVRADGNMIVGTFMDDFFELKPFVWTPEFGMVTLEQFIAGAGLDTLGYIPLSATAVSDDGLTIAGVALSPRGMFEAYVLTVPSPGSAMPVLGVLGIAGVRRRRPAHGAGRIA
jgi:uncharacterized membrane protein